MASTSIRKKLIAHAYEYFQAYVVHGDSIFIHILHKSALCHMSHQEKMTMTLVKDIMLEYCARKKSKRLQSVVSEL